MFFIISFPIAFTLDATINIILLIPTFLMICYYLFINMEEVLNFCIDLYSKIIKLAILIIATPFAVLLIFLFITMLTKTVEEKAYEELGFDKGVRASESEINKAFRSRALKCHPDKNPNDPNAASKFKKIKSAHELLTNS